MNPNTRLRLWKEARALLPMWAAVAVWIAAPFLLPVNDPLPYAFSGFLFGCAVLGPVCVGHEFTHRTMGALLAQPVPRRQLWREKLAVTGAALLGLSLLLVLSIELKSTTALELAIVHASHWAAEGDSLGVARFIAVPVLVPLMAFFTGPALTLVTRNSLGGAAATFIYPFFLLIGGVLLVASQGDLSPRLEEQFLFSYVLLVGGIYSGGVFLYGCRRFERLEDANLLAQELAPPRQLSALFSCFTRHTTPGRHGATANLLRKELRLQQPAFLVALFLVALWLTFIVVWQVHPPVGAEILVVPSILLALGIPITVGIVSTAEERNLGVHEWHLTLPVSARRQWCVKVIVALGVNVLLGIALPGLLAHASSWLANNPQLVAEIPGRNVPAFLIANLVLFCAALYASTVSANGIRALVGAIVLFVVGAVVVNLSLLGGRWRNQWVHSDSFSNFRSAGWPAPEVMEWAVAHLTPLGWIALLLWLLALGYANFRRTLAVGWASVRRLVPFFVGAAVFLGGMFNFHILCGNYYVRFYELDTHQEHEWGKRAKQRALERALGGGQPGRPAPSPDSLSAPKRD